MTKPPPNPPDDDPSKPLVEWIQAGKGVEANFARLYRLHHGRVYRFFLCLGFNVAESEDLTQDTFMRVYKSIGSFKYGSRFERWLLVIAHNIYCNEIRRRHAESRGLPEVSLDNSERETDVSAALVAPGPGQLEEAVQHQRSDALRGAIEALPKQMRLCVQFRVYQMLQYKEIAERMGVSIETVKAHLHQAQDRLRIAFLEDEDEPDPGP